MQEPSRRKQRPLPRLIQELDWALQIHLVVAASDAVGAAREADGVGGEVKAGDGAGLGKPVRT